MGDQATLLSAALKALGNVPASVWGVLLGSGLTLLAAWLTNRHGLKIQARQFTFERNERQRELQLQLRRDVYLPAADAVVGMATCISKALNLNTTDEEFNRLTENFGSAIARVQMVATEETIKHASALQRAFLIEFLSIMRDRYPLMLRQSEIGIAAKSMNSYQTERDRCIELMKAYNLDGSRDAARWNAIQRQQEFSANALADVTVDWRRLTTEQLVAQMALTRSLGERLTPLIQLQVKALVAIRADLELSGAATTLLAELEHTASEMQRALISTVEMVELTTEQLRNDDA